MAVYVPPIDSRTDPRKPGTAEWGKAVDDRPIAVAEGAVGAPRVQGVALGNVHLFSGILSTTPVAFTGLDQLRDLMIVGTAQHDGTNGAQLRVGFSSDGGSTWGASQDVIVASNTNDWLTATVTINVVTGAGYYIGSGNISGTSGPVVGGLALTVPANVNAVRLLRATSANTVHASLFVIGGRV
jgi:hypothetical protein